MKYFQLILLCFICIAKSHGQLVVEITKQKHPTRIYAKVELKSATPGVDSAWVRSLEINLNRSMQLDKHVKKGKYIVTVKFIVSKDGSLSDISCDQDPGFGMCREVLRVLMKTKSWRPAGSY